MITENSIGLSNSSNPNMVYSYQDNSINDNRLDFAGSAPLPVALQ